MARRASHPAAGISIRSGRRCDHPDPGVLDLPERQHASGSRQLFLVLTVLTLLYVWRFGLHPRLSVTDQNVEIINPFRRYSFDWDDITVIAPGENGLLIGSEDNAAEAWCVQKSNFASRRGRLTRADRIANQLLDIVELHDPPIEDLTKAGYGSDARVRMRAGCLPGWNVLRASEALTHIFPPIAASLSDRAVARRWRRVLHDRLMHAYILDVRDSPVGYVAFNGDTVHHLGIVPEESGAGTAPRCWSSRAWRSSPVVPRRRSVGC